MLTDTYYSLFYRALLQKRPILLRSLLIVATPFKYFVTYECVMRNVDRYIYCWTNTEIWTDIYVMWHMNASCEMLTDVMWKGVSQMDVIRGTPTWYICYVTHEMLTDVMWKGVSQMNVIRGTPTCDIHLCYSRESSKCMSYAQIAYVGVSQMNVIRGTPTCDIHLCNSWESPKCMSYAQIASWNPSSVENPSPDNKRIWTPTLTQMGEDQKVLQFGANGTNQTKKGIQGRKPASKELLGRCDSHIFV